MRPYYSDHVNPPFTSLRSIHFPPIFDKTKVDWDDYARRYDEAQALMRSEHRWFEDGQNYYFQPGTHKKIALGRAQFYVQFVDFYFERYGQRLYLLDFMLRQDDLSGLDGLLFYIEDAEEIHINLEGVLVEELAYSTMGLGRLATDKGDIGAPFATAWEINQVFHKGLLPITWFHTGSAMTRLQAYRAMGRRVPLSRIRSDNRFLVRDWLRRKRKALLEEDVEEL